MGASGPRHCWRYAVAGGDWMPGYRLFHSVIGHTCLLLPLYITVVRRPFAGRLT